MALRLPDDDDLERLAAEARAIRPAVPARAGLLLVARALWLAGWLAARAVLGAWALGRVLWLAAAWSYATVRLGWREAWEASWRGRELEARRLAAGARRG